MAIKLVTWFKTVLKPLFGNVTDPSVDFKPNNDKAKDAQDSCIHSGLGNVMKQLTICNASGEVFPKRMYYVFY